MGRRRERKAGEFIAVGERGEEYVVEVYETPVEPQVQGGGSDVLYGPGRLQTADGLEVEDYGDHLIIKPTGRRLTRPAKT